jgi:hypothetical protein
MIEGSCNQQRNEGMLEFNVSPCLSQNCTHME